MIRKIANWLRRTFSRDICLHEPDTETHYATYCDEYDECENV